MFVAEQEKLTTQSWFFLSGFIQFAIHLLFVHSGAYIISGAYDPPNITLPLSAEHIIF